MPSKDKYTDPELHDQVKEEIKESDKGGAPGQWSARKAQFMAQEYKKRGGTYRTDKETGQDESQKNLSKWSEEDWQTKDGSGEARQEDGSRKRYLPKKAWEQMDDEEQNTTDAKKQEASKDGQQFVGNTASAKEARQNANEEESEHMEKKKEKQAAEKGKGSNGTSNGSRRGRKAKSDANKKTNESAAAEDEDEEDDGQEEDVDDEAEDDEEDFQEDDEVSEDDEEEGDESNTAEDEEKSETKLSKPHAGQKRKNPSSSNNANKKQKDNRGQSKSQTTVGSKHDPSSAPANTSPGSTTRLPKVGQKASWKALPGWVHGEVIEIVREDTEIEGKRIKGSREDPRIALRADSGKVCGHKPEGVYFGD